MRKNRQKPAPTRPFSKPDPVLCAPRTVRLSTFNVNVEGMSVPLDAVRRLVTETADFPDDSKVSVGTEGGDLYSGRARRICRVSVSQQL